MVLESNVSSNSFRTTDGLVAGSAAGDAQGLLQQGLRFAAMPLRLAAGVEQQIHRQIGLRIGTQRSAS